MKLKKNHYHPASLIGNYWGYFSEINKKTLKYEKNVRLKNVCKLDLLSYYLSLRKKENKPISFFVTNDTAEKVCYSRIYLEETEKNICVNKKEEAFLKFIKNYQNNVSVLTHKGNKKVIVDYVSLMSLRNPSHYNLSIIDTQPFILENIFSIPQIIEYNNRIINNKFNEVNSHYYNFEYKILSGNLSNTLKIFLGNTTHLTKKSQFFQTTFLEKINNKIGKYKVIQEKDFVLIPITTNSFLFGIEKKYQQGDNQKINHLFNIFSKNFSTIVNIWNEIQILTSHEIIFHYNDINKIEQHLFFNKKIAQNLIHIIYKNIDFNLNNILNTNENKNLSNLYSNIDYKYQNWKTSLLQLNNHKKIPIHVDFIKKPQKKKLNNLNIDQFIFKVFFNNIKLILKFNIRKTGEVYIVDNNIETFYCYDFYQLLFLIKHQHFLIIVSNNQKVLLNYDSIQEWKNINTQSLNFIKKYRQNILNTKIVKQYNV